MTKAAEQRKGTQRGLGVGDLDCDQSRRFAPTALFALGESELHGHCHVVAEHDHRPRADRCELLGLSHARREEQHGVARSL